MAGIDLNQYLATPNQPNASPKEGGNVDLNQYLGSQDQVQSEPSSFLNTLGSYAKDAAKAIPRAGAAILDFASPMAGLPMITEEPSKLPWGKEPTSLHSAAKEAMPYKNNIFGEAVEGAALGASVGFPGPAVGAGVGAVMSGGSAIIDQYFPNAPLATKIGVPLGAALLTGGAMAKVAGRATHLAGEGLGIAERPALVQAKDRLGIRSGTAASTVDDPFWHDLQTGVREATLVPGSKSIQRNIASEQEELGSAVSRQAEALFPAQSRQQLGTHAQTATEDGVGAIKQIFSRQEQALDNLVSPNTRVPMIPYIDRAINDIASTRGAHIPLTGGQTQHGDAIVSRLMDNIIDDASANNSLTVSAIREHKQKVGDQLKASLLNGDANHRELTQIYGVLADAQGSAYGVVRGVNPAGAPTYTATTPQAQQYLALKAAESEMYRNIGAFAEKVIKQGVTPERMAAMATNEIKMGGTKLAELLNIMEQASPTIRNEFASETLRWLGRNAQGEFSPQRFFTRWQNVTPEARQALFGRGPNQDIPQIYDDLALVAQNQGRGASAVNTSRTGSVNEIFSELKTWGAIIGGLGAAGAGGLAASKRDMAGSGDNNMPSVATGAGIGYALGHLGGAAVMGKMLTNPAFLRWIATPTVTDLPRHRKALSAIAADSPEIGPAINSFAEYLETKGFAEGGYVDRLNITEGETYTILDMIMGSQPSFSENDSVISMPRPNDEAVNDAFRQEWRAGEDREAGMMEMMQKRMHPPEIELAEGGSVHPDTRRIMGNEAPPNARSDIKNPRSSASGKGQFIDSTWLAMMRKYRPDIADPMSVKHNDKLQTEMTELYRQENNKYLSSKGHPVTPGTSYLAHFLGPAGASKVLSNPNVPVANLFDKKVIAANPFLKNMNTTQLVAMMDKKMSGQPTQMMTTSASSGQSILDMAMPSTSMTLEDDDTEDKPNQKGMELAQEHSQHAASIGADPLVQSVIKTIWSHADV